MKKRSNILKTLLLSVVMTCMATTLFAQDIAIPADYNENSTSAMLRSMPQRMVMIRGDVNGDGIVNITDAIVLINALKTGESPVNGDVNRDGSINITDAIQLINMILNSSSSPTTEILEALNSIYTSMRTYGWSTTGNYHHSFGISSYNIMGEVMGDDMIMGAQGSGWFWYDAAYNVKNRFNSQLWRSYDLWTAYYTWIANANYIITVCENISGSDSEIDYIKGQAYAIRAYSFFMLAQNFARTYAGHQDEPCVPCFPGNVFTGSTGYARSTVAQVYSWIINDYSNAYFLLKDKPQQAPEHISFSVLQGLRARTALVMEDWSAALSYAADAIQTSGKRILEVSEFKGLNDVHADNVMWGADIPSEESTQYASFWAHMDASKSYFQTAPKLISKWLYNKMSATDARRAWWGPNTTYAGSDAPMSLKFNVVDGTEWEGDYIWMRVEEMYLIAAEAACRRNLPNTSRNYLNQLMAKRDPNYSCTKTGTQLGALTTDETGSLLEEILIQRRLELWGEDGRIYTIRRLRQGFERTTENGWPTQLITGNSLNDPECYAWVLTIPASEFNGNTQMNPEFMPIGDQNPLGDYPGTGQNVSFETSSSSITTARTDFNYPVTLTRTNTKGIYLTSVKLSDADQGLSLSVSTFNVAFADGQSTANVIVYCSGLTLGQTYHGTLTLTPYDEACSNSSPQITTHTFTINCTNGNPEGQNISFEMPSSFYSVNTTNKSVPVTLTRSVTEGEYNATIIMTENQNNVELTNPHVFFADGSSTATAWVYFNDMEFGQTYGCLLTLSPQDAATGGAITSTRITVTRENWINLGYIEYHSSIFGDDSGMLIQQIADSNVYRIINIYEGGYDITFTIDEENKVYLEPQPFYMFSNYGLFYMRGYANEDDSNYAGTFNPATRLISMKILYYSPGVGSYPVSTDEFYLP